MPNPAVALQNLEPSVQQRLVVDGYVSSTLPAPSSFTAPLYVTVPEHSTEVPIGPCDWGAIHGTSLPKQGAACVVVFDEREIPVVVWWEGSQKEPTPAAGSITEAMLETALQTRVTADSGWKEPVLLNSWKNKGGAFLKYAYRKQGNVVRFRGAIESGASGAELFTLPEGFRPTATAVFGAVGNGPAVGLTTVTAAGVVSPFYTAADKTVYFDGFTFTID